MPPGQVRIDDLEKRDAIDQLIDMVEARDPEGKQTHGLMKKGVWQALYEVDDPYAIDVNKLRRALGLPPKR